MREILDVCVKMDRFAERLYAALAEQCPEPGLATTFSRLAVDEAQHTGWWEGLLEAWEHGLLPDLVNDTTGLAERLADVHDELSRIDLGSIGDLDVEKMLALAARVEFFMIDPVFSELIELTEPAQSEHRHAAYQAHIQRLVNEIAARYPDDSLAALLASSLSRAWKDNRRLSVYATHDALTGLYNRRALYTHLPQWTAWSARYGHPLAVLLIDIDRFKDINDTRGHAIGDRALASIAQAMRHVTRASDLVVRYGGDEFAVIAPETGVGECADLANRIVEAIRQVSVSTDDGSAVPLTVSIGSAVAHDVAGSPPYRVESLLAAADQALYSAKSAGRDRAADPLTVERV
jgi:diguanylate cyclase (GGDEF)-like protein